jgi:hypothetical protein
VIHPFCPTTDYQTDGPSIYSIATRNVCSTTGSGSTQPHCRFVGSKSSYNTLTSHGQCPNQMLCSYTTRSTKNNASVVSACTTDVGDVPHAMISPGNVSVDRVHKLFGE